jgi:hypothetical protein
MESLHLIAVISFPMFACILSLIRMASLSSRLDSLEFAAAAFRRHLARCRSAWTLFSSFPRLLGPLANLSRSNLHNTPSPQYPTGLNCTCLLLSSWSRSRFLPMYMLSLSLPLSARRLPCIYMYIPFLPSSFVFVIPLSYLSALLCPCYPFVIFPRATFLLNPLRDLFF